MTAPDPLPFLSTIAAVSATLVAIVGGLLVARFVTITSEQEGAQQLINDAQERLAIANKRKKKADDKLHSWHVDDFFEVKVIRAISEGKRSARKLRRIGNDTPLANDEIAKVVQAISDEFEKARLALKRFIPVNEDTDDYPDWNEFKKPKSNLPETNWDGVWEVAYEDLVRPSRPHLIRPALPDIGIYAPNTPTPREYIKLRAERRDALRTNIDQAKQQVEDIESEVARLRRAREGIVRPKGLGYGLVVLAYFTLVGVIIPLWLMSRGPARLTAHLGQFVFWFFLSGLLALLGYMTVLALRLSGWWIKTDNTN